MRDEIIIEYKGDHVHVRHYGKDIYDISLNLWHRIVETCEACNCFNVLGETHTTEGLSTMDNYNHIEIFKQAGVTLHYRIAWVAQVPERAREIRFVGTVLKNRGLACGGIFRSVAEARRWLLGVEDELPDAATDAP